MFLISWKGKVNKLVNKKYFGFLRYRNQILTYNFISGKQDHFLFFIYLFIYLFFCIPMKTFLFTFFIEGHQLIKKLHFWKVGGLSGKLHQFRGGSWSLFEHSRRVDPIQGLGSNPHSPYRDQTACTSPSVAGVVEERGCKFFLVFNYKLNL